MAIGETFKRQVEIMLPKTKRGEQLEAMHDQYRQLRATEADKRREMAEKNQELRDLRAACDRLSEALATGKFVEEVQCEERLVGKEVHVVRVDTGSVVEKRAATAAELQIDAFTDSIAGKAVANRGKDGNAEAPPPKKRGRPKGSKSKGKDASA